MKRTTAFAAAAVLVAAFAGVSAQSGGGQMATKPADAGAVSLAGDLKKDWSNQKDLMMAIADAMPEDKFGFKSTPAQRSYGEQILHVAGANVMIMKLIDSAATAPTIDQKATAKAPILKALADSYDFGNTVLKSQTDATFQQVVPNAPAFLGPSTRARLAYTAMNHAMDIYGQMAVYLRLNNIVPPVSRRGGM